MAGLAATPSPSLALAIGCLALALCGDGVSAALAFERRAVLAGEFWRLWTGHAVHFSLAHALANAGVLFACGRLVETAAGARRTVLLMLAGAPLISLALLLFAPAMAEYRGASGLASAFAVPAAAALWPLGRAWRLAITGATATFTIKTVLEAYALPIGSAVLPDGVGVAWQSHLLGACIGAVSAWSSRLVRRSRPIEGRLVFSQTARRLMSLWSR